MKSKTTSRPRKQPVGGPSRPTDASGSAARDHYHREKARRAKRALPETEAMAAARREYLALLESDAAKGKGGRPRKKPAARPKTGDLLDDELPEHDEELDHDAPESEEAEEADTDE
jgi:hypothetical protein